MTNNEVKTYNPKPIQQGQGQRLILTTSYAIIGYTFTAYLIIKETRVRAATYTIVADTGTKTITMTLTDTVTTALEHGNYDFELWQLDATSFPTWLLKGDQIIKQKSTAATP